MSRAHIPFAKSNVGLRALQSIDIAVRHAESFAAMQDAIVDCSGADGARGNCRPLGLSSLFFCGTFLLKIDAGAIEIVF